MRIQSVFLSSLLCLTVALSASCGRGVTSQDIIAAHREVEQVPNEIVPGYNEPLQYEKGIGLRAVNQGALLLISVRNRTDETVTLGPAAFRLLLPGEAYAFGTHNDDLSNFPVRAIEPGRQELFSVRLARLNDPADLALVLNYPPRDVLMRVFVEPVPQPE